MGDSLIKVCELNYPNCRVKLCCCVQIHKHNIHSTKSLADIACCYRTHPVPPTMPNAPCTMWGLTGLERPLTPTLITYMLVYVCKYTCTHTHTQTQTPGEAQPLLKWGQGLRHNSSQKYRRTNHPPATTKAHPSRPPPPRDNPDCTLTVATQRPPYIHGSHISLRAIGLNCPHPAVLWSRQLGTRETEPPRSIWEGRYGTNIWQDSLELGTQPRSLLWSGFLSSQSVGTSQQAQTVRKMNILWVCGPF